MNNKILTILVAVISILGIGMYINVSRLDEENVAAISNAVSPLVSYSFWLFIGVVVVAVLASLWGLFKNPAALKKTLIGLAVLGVLLVVSYFASSDGLVMGADNTVLTEKGSVSKWVGTGITYSIILGAFASFFLRLGLIERNY